MAKTTPATLALAQADVNFTVHRYDYDPTAARVGLQAAEAMGVAPDQVLKTLMVLVDAEAACIIIPSDSEASMKKVAAAFGGKSAQMMPVPQAEKLTGYKVGGISPFGQKRMVRTAIEETALGHEQVYINGGQRGLQVRLSPIDAARAANAVKAGLIA